MEASTTRLVEWRLAWGAKIRSGVCPQCEGHIEGADQDKDGAHRFRPCGCLWEPPAVCVIER